MKKFRELSKEQQKYIKVKETIEQELNEKEQELNKKEKELANNKTKSIDLEYQNKLLKEGLDDLKNQKQLLIQELNNLKNEIKELKKSGTPTKIPQIVRKKR